MTARPDGWHVDDDLLEDYADGVPLAPALQASVEKHLEGCASCRVRLAPAVDSARLDAVWAEVVAQVDAPQLGLVVRGLQRLGVREDTARLLAVTPSMRVPWLLSLTAVLALALLTAHTVDRGVVLFLARSCRSPGWPSPSPR
jgi:CubicO group peptidase (beta-lactamase class C family)